MRSGDQSGFWLVPETGVEIIDGKTMAGSPPVWLRLEPAAAIRPGSWVRLRYRSSFFDDNVRPLIRITDNTDQSRVQVMNGTMFGVGEWTGYMPDNIAAISISPVARAGQFDFRIERVDFVAPLQLFVQGVKSNPRLIVRIVETWLRGARDESRRALRFAGSSTDFAEYDRWSRHLTRDADFDGIDRPRSDWTKTPQFRLFMSVGRAAPHSIQSTVRSLLAQIYGRWTLQYSIEGDCPPERQAEIRAAFAGDPRIAEIAADADMMTIAAGCTEDDICALISAGDMLPEFALALVAETAAQRPQVGVVYGDEDSLSLSSGKFHSPALNPDWSPYFQAARSYIGQPAWLRLRDVLRAGPKSVGQFMSAHHAIVTSVLADSAKESVFHIRRVLCHHSREATEVAEPAPTVQLRRAADSMANYPDVSVILPTRDNADCLAACIDGLMNGTDYPNLRVVLVDNGSVKPDAVVLLRDLKRNPQIDILERPGPFNYSALCNEAVRASQAPMLVLLNDDIAMCDRGWLKPLVYWATRPDVGMVGAKLLFPNGRIQHAGVVLGLGGIAAHLYHEQDPAQAGYLERLTVPHEVGAVTAACVAVERKKFDAVGGFDAANLPVDLNDIDLCLRLAERGFVAMWTPESVLIHHESASRGRTPWSSELYRAERTYFVARWQAAIRDDRYFHPNLSLFSYRPALA